MGKVTHGCRTYQIHSQVGTAGASASVQLLAYSQLQLPVLQQQLGCTEEHEMSSIAEVNGQHKQHWQQLNNVESTCRFEVAGPLQPGIGHLSCPAGGRGRQYVIPTEPSRPPEQTGITLNNMGEAAGLGYYIVPPPGGGSLGRPVRWHCQLWHTQEQDPRGPVLVMDEV